MYAQREVKKKSRFGILLHLLLILLLLSSVDHRRRKLLKAGGAQEVVINFELFAVNVGVADT